MLIIAQLAANTCNVFPSPISSARIQPLWTACVCCTSSRETLTFPLKACSAAGVNKPTCWAKHHLSVPGAMLVLKISHERKCPVGECMLWEGRWHLVQKAYTLLLVISQLPRQKRLNKNLAYAAFLVGLLENKGTILAFRYENRGRLWPCWRCHRRHCS